MSIRIVIDSTADVTEDIIKKYNLKMVPLSVNFNDGSYLDKVELSSGEFFEKLSRAEKLPTTSQVSPGTFAQVFEEILAAGDDVLGIFLAEEFSGTYHSACIAKDMINSDRIHIIDSRSVCLGAFALILEAVELVKSGAELHNIAERLKEVRGGITIAACIDTLKYLEKGGRLSKSQAVIGSVLNIKPVITVKDGKIDVVDKIRGKNKAVRWLDDYIDKGGYDFSDKTLLLFHACSREQAELLERTLRVKRNIKDVIIAEVGPVIGTHTGPGVLAIGFLNK